MRISTKLTVAITALATAAAFTFSACRKNKDKDMDTEDTGYAADHATLEKSFSDAQSIADEAGTDGNLSSFKMQGSYVPLSQCATITNDTIASPHVLTIDFGAANCLCNDGSYRRGQIIVTYTGRYRDMGHTHTITFSNYFVNDDGVSGTKTVSYNSNTASGQPIYTIDVTGQVVLANGNGTISWTSTRTRTWLQGFDTKSWMDDEYEISGTGKITRAEGRVYDVTTQTPLHVALNCRWIESGVVEMHETSLSGNQVLTRTLDYGSGACDNQATVQYNGKTHTVTLR